MTHEEFANICLQIKNGNTDISIPCCANCRSYHSRILDKDHTIWECYHPELEGGDGTLMMAPEDFCSRYECKGKAILIFKREASNE